jgi:predicted nucleotidyltransferase
MGQSMLDVLLSRREELLMVSEKHGVASIRLFGSVARGDDQAASDIDFLVTTGPEVSAWFPAQLIHDLEQILGRPVDVVTEAGLNPHFRDQIISESIAL